MKDVSDLCRDGKHHDCDGMVYRESRGMMEVVAPCSCGCHYPVKNLKSKDVDWKIRKAREEENGKTERLIAGLQIFKREVKVDE